MDEVVWNHAVYSKNRERLLNAEIAASFFARVLERARPFMSDEHFTVDGTLIEAWASQKSFRPKDGSGKPAGQGGEVDFRGQKRKNETHESTTDPDARLWTKSRGSEAKLSYMGHVMMENRNGLLVETFLTEANGRAERDAALLMAEAVPQGKRVTLGGDKNYDTREFVQELRGMNITPHVAQNTTNRRSAIDERTTRHAGYEVSQRKRKRVEQSFGWMKIVDAKEGEVERNRQCGVAVYLYWGGLQPVPIAKPDGQNVTRGFDKPARSIEKPKPLPYHSAKTQN
jgi:hypothetical protein